MLIVSMDIFIYLFVLILLLTKYICTTCDTAIANPTANELLNKYERISRIQKYVLNHRIYFEH